MQNFGQNIKYLRKINHLSQKDLADYLNISVNSYQRYEYGTREPNLETIKQIAKFFNVPTDFLLGSGVFENWEQILKHKTEVENAISHVIPKLSEVFANNDTIVFIRILSAMVEKVSVDPSSERLDLYFFINDFSIT